MAKRKARHPHKGQAEKKKKRHLEDEEDEHPGTSRKATKETGKNDRKGILHDSHDDVLDGPSRSVLITPRRSGTTQRSGRWLEFSINHLVI